MENNLFKNKQGFMAIAGALILPFVFALCAIAFDLGVGLLNHSRLSDLLIESSLMSSSTSEDEDMLSDKIYSLSQSFFPPSQKIKDVQIHPQEGLGMEQNPLISVYASLENQAFFENFINPQKSQNKALDAYAKYEGLEGELAYSDYVFSIAFTGSATQSSSLSPSNAKKICSLNDFEIEKGYCNPPLGEPKAIDAVQSMVAYTIALAKSFDKEDAQHFGFVPYGGGSQVRGRDLGIDANIDYNDGVSNEERKNLTYVVWPIQIFSPSSFKNYDIYSRFYPKEILDQSNSLLRDKVLKRLEALGVDTSLLTHLDLSEYLLSKFELNVNNPLLSQYSLADFGEAKEAMDLIFENQAMGEENGLANNPSNVAMTIENIFNQSQSVIYRLYDKNIDTLKLSVSKDELIDASKNIKTAQASLNSILADINILRTLKDKIANGEIELGGGGGGGGESPLDKITSVDGLYDFIYDQMDNNSDAYYEHEEKYCVTSDGYNDCEGKIIELEDAGKNHQEIIAELHFNELVGGGGGSSKPPSLGEILGQHQDSFLPPHYKELEGKIKSLKAEIESLKDNGIYKLCSNINSYTESYVIEMCETTFKDSFEKTQKAIQTKEKELAEIQPQYLQALSQKEALDRLIDRASNDSDPDVFLANLENEKSLLTQKIKTYEETLKNGVEIKGKALCNSFATFINGASCQSRSAGGLKFHEINLRKIKDSESIKEIDLLNQDPFEIDRRFGTYITGVGQEHDYASIGLIRSALMLSKSQTQNPNAKIIVFSTTANQNDEALFKAGLCRAIKEGIKTRTGANVEIFAVALGLPTDERKEVNQEKYKKIWSYCTQEENILLGDDIDTLLEKISKSVFKGGGGKITFDPVKK